MSISTMISWLRMAAFLSCGMWFVATVHNPTAVAQEKQIEPSSKTANAVEVSGPPYRGLDASLYMLTSAEYRASCLQTFRWAALSAKQKLDARTDKTLPPAAIIDLDETILDNGWFQSQQIRAQAGFDAIRWEEWELNGPDKVRLVPGAKKFIDRLVELGITPVFITNRNDRSREQAKKILARFEIQVTESQLLCADASTGSNKTSRREAVKKKFDVLIYVGDNLRDFDERFKYDTASAGAGRSKTVDDLADKFGEEWFILPNPSYGEWMKPFKNSSADVELLYK